MIWSMNLFKALGLDGYSEIFFIKFWNIIREHMVKFVNKAFITKKVWMSIASFWFQSLTYMFQPFPSYTFKVVSKILANKLHHFLLQIISPNQGAFVEGRWIEENTMITQELVSKVKKHRGGNGHMLIKMDMKKTYDRLEWEFVDKFLES